MLFLQRVKYFNSIKVQLKPAVEVVEGNDSIDFNSIKVQLKQEGEPLYIIDLIFQFHKGTIKTEVERIADNFDRISIP